MMESVKSNVVWNEHGFAANDGYVKAHTASSSSGEYAGEVEVWVSKGTGLPAHAYLDQPPSADSGFAIVRSQACDAWITVQDHRGEVVYNKHTKEQLLISELGPIPDEYTDLAPSSPFDIWSGAAWVRDENAESMAAIIAAQEEQSSRLYIASQQIAILKPAVDGGYAKPEHSQLLSDWQRYRYELTMIPDQAGWPERPQWPAQPATVI